MRIEGIFRFCGLLGLSLAILLLYWSFRIAWADWISRERTRASILAAIHLFPDNSLFYLDWAEIEPSDALTALRQAAAVNPMNPAIRLDLGRFAEKAGNLAEAEASFVAAVALGRTFGPRRILADFYFRHRETQKFWPAVYDALDHSFGDTTNLFEDCWGLSTDPRLILDRAIPDRPHVLDSYLEFLMSHEHLEAAQPVADRLMTNNSLESGPVLLTYCDHLVFDNSADRAVTVWNWLCKRKFLPYEILEPEKGQSLTNGSFTFPTLSQGFDWRLSPPDGLYLEQRKALNLTFTGKQPEKCEIVSEVLPLEPDRKYRLRVEYNTSDIDRESGLSWRVMILKGPDLLLGSLPGGQQSFTGYFATTRDTQLGRLVLTYERVKGTVRIEGSAQIRSVELSYAE